MSFDLHKITRAVHALGMAGTTFIGIALVLVVPALLGSSPNLLLYLAALIVGIQAAQSSVIQVGRSLEPLIGRRAWVPGLAAVLIAVLCIVVEIPTMASATLATIAGALLGLLLGSSGLTILGGKGASSFQSFQALKALLLVVAAASAALGEKFVPGAGPAIATFLVALLAFPKPKIGRRRIGFRDPPPHTMGSAWSVLLGLGAALFYRNDVNWIRSALAESNEFWSWHYSLIAYAAVQGLIGFVVVQVLFAKRELWKVRISQFSARRGLYFALIWAGSVSVGMIVLPSMPVVASVLGSAVLAAFVGVLSGVAHVVDLSWVTYAAGTLGVAVLLVVLAFRVDPRMALVVENTVIGSFIVALVLLLRRPQCSSLT